MSHPNVLSSWILVLLPYHEKWVEVWHNDMSSFFLYTSDDVSSENTICVFCWLPSRIPDLIMFCKILLWGSFFTLGNDASPPVFLVDILKLSTRILVTSSDFYQVSYSSTLTHLHGWFCSSIFLRWIKKFLLGLVWMCLGISRALLYFYTPQLAFK